MSSDATHLQWLNSVLVQLRAFDDVAYELAEDGRVRLIISHNGVSRELFVDPTDDEYRVQKIQYAEIRNTLTQLGIEEGRSFAVPKLPRRPMTPQMRATREKQKIEFDAWQEVWHTLRKAEKTLDVNYEIAQMRDYY